MTDEELNAKLWEFNKVVLIRFIRKHFSEEEIDGMIKEVQNEQGSIADLEGPLESMMREQREALTRREGESIVDYLNRRQACPYLHPYTCGKDSNHVLRATEGGWECPECDYRQAYSSLHE